MMMNTVRWGAAWIMMAVMVSLALPNVEGADAAETAAPKVTVASAAESAPVPAGDAAQKKKRPHMHELPPPLRGGMQPQRIQEFFRRLQRENPQELKRLQELRVKDRDKFIEEIRKAIPLGEQERRHFELDRQCFELARQIQESSDEARRAELEGKLDACLAESLDVMLKRSEEKLEEMRRYVEWLKNNRETILNGRRKFFLETLPLQPEKPGKE